jgi:dipeptidyl aminopeptidase/acylaminoacyl peptidase
MTYPFARTGLVVSGLLLGPLFLPLEGAGAQERRWEVEDVLGLKSVNQVAISPDGRWIAYAVTRNDLEAAKTTSNIWLVDVAGGVPVQLTRGDESDRAPEWAPDGTWLAFLSTRGETAQVYGIRPTGGEAWRVTEWGPGVGSFAISPDGGKIAFGARAEESEQDKERKERFGQPMVWDSAYARDWTHLWVAPLRDGVAVDVVRSSPERISVGSFVWSPDSKGLAWSGGGMADQTSAPTRDRPTGFSRESDVYVQTAPGAAPVRVTNLRGSESPEAWIAGLGLIVSGTGQDLGTYNRRLWLADTQGGTAPAALTERLDENATLVEASLDALLVEAQHRTGARLYRIALSTGRPAGDPVVVSDDRLIYAGFSATPDLKRVAFVAQGPTTSPNVHTSELGVFSARQLSDVNPQIANLALGEQRVVHWKSAHDGEEIEGVLTLPVGYQPGRRVPLLLIIHGGPSGVSLNSFNPGGRYPSQVFSSLGYASLQPNYRGSTGYGERFRGLNRGHISGHDWIDVNSGVDHLIAEGIADADRLGIMGWSFGGHHTFWGITQTDRFKAASAGAGATDLISMYSQTDLPGFYHTYLGPRPWEDFDLYEDRSAYRFVDRVMTPLLIQVGERDERVPAEQSIQFYEAMSAIGKAPVKLVIYPGEGHGLREITHIRDMMQRNVEWFSRWIPVTRTAADGVSR